MNVRQAVVVRRDLNMTPGLLAAQVAHISAQSLYKTAISPSGFNTTQFQWMNSPTISILAVDTPEELYELRTRAKELNIPYLEWEDTIPSKIFAGQFLHVIVGASFGPVDEEKLKQVTGILPLY